MTRKNVAKRQNKSKPAPKNHKVYELKRANRNAEGRAWLETKDVAVLIRSKLVATFPGVKFSVRSGWPYICVSWIDGPRRAEVERVTRAYEFGRFDDSIDLRYSVENWLTPDGSMMLAHSVGTRHNGGYHPSQTNDPPHPQAVLVRGGGVYVSCHQEFSSAKIARMHESAQSAVRNAGLRDSVAWRNGTTTEDELVRLPRLLNKCPGFAHWLRWAVKHDRDEEEVLVIDCTELFRAAIGEDQDAADDMDYLQGFMEGALTV